MKNITVYNNEIRDGLQDTISNNVISYASTVTQFKVAPAQNDIWRAVAATVKKDQPDLIHRYAILASVGRNENDDVFDKLELWNARATPVDKQVNFMHNELNIIGHMTEAFAMDINGNLLSDGMSPEMLPDTFDVGVGFVLYTLWEDEARAALIDKVVSEIDSGNWFVSMECRFPNFDYLVTDKNNVSKVVARDEKSAFLTKYLRAYGGNGIYQDYKIARMPRDLFFCGKGIVDNPANKRSIIFGNTAPFSSKGTLILRENIMDEKEIAAMKLDLATAQAEVAKLKTEQTQKAQAAVNSEIETLKAEVKTLENAKASVEATAKTELATANENLTKALAEAKKISDELASAKETIAKAQAEAVKVNRIGQLVKAGLDEAKAAEVYAKWQSVGDDQFSDVVALHSKAACMEPDEDDAEKKAKATKEAAEKAAADLAKAELEKSKAGNTTPDADNDIVKLAERLTRFMPKAQAAQASKTKE